MLAKAKENRLLSRGNDDAEAVDVERERRELALAARRHPSPEVTLIHQEQRGRWRRNADNDFLQALAIRHDSRAGRRREIAELRRSERRGMLVETPALNHLHFLVHAMDADHPRSDPRHRQGAIDRASADA